MQRWQTRADQIIGFNECYETQARNQDEFRAHKYTSRRGGAKVAYAHFGSPETSS